MAFATLCPMVTVACGKPDQTFGADHHALAFSDACLHLDALPVAQHDMDLFTPSLPSPCRHCPRPCECRWPPGIPLMVTDENGNKVTSRYFTLANDEIRTTRRVIPSMFSLDTGIIHQDCLGYLMGCIDPA